MKTVTIVTINYNGEEDTIECLKSLENLNSNGLMLRILVVDNNSDPKSVSRISKQIKSLNTKSKHTYSLIELSENLGFSGGNNIGIRQALSDKSDYIWLLNNDTYVDSNALVSLVSFIQSNKNAGIAGSKIYFAKGYEYHKERYRKEELGTVLWYAGGSIDWSNVVGSHRGVDEVDNGQYDNEEPTDFVTGCSFFMRRETALTVGYFDDDYFLYLEDMDYCIRAIKKGVELWYVPDSVVWHKNAQSSDKPGSPIHVYYQTRNRLLFGMKYAPLRTKLALFRESFRIKKRDEVSNQAVNDFYKRSLGKKTS